MRRKILPAKARRQNMTKKEHSKPLAKQVPSPEGGPALTSISRASLTTERPVTFKTLIAYGVGDIYGGGAFIIVSLFYMFFMTEVVGLSPALAGLALGIGKVWDAITDPLMGYLSDHTRSRYGRRRVYFLVGIVPIALSYIIMWIRVQASSQVALFFYYLFAYILFDAVITMVMTPYSALAAELSADYKVRNRLSAARLFFSGFSSLLASTVPSMIINAHKEDPAQGYLIMSIVFGILFAIPWIFVFWGTWENPHLASPTVSRDFMKEFASILKNKSFRIHLMMYVFAYSAMDMLMGLFTYYLTYYLQRPNIYSIAMGTLMIVQLFMILVYTKVANTKGKRFAYILGMSIFLAGLYATIVLTSSTPLLVLVLICAVIGLGTAAAVYIPYAILPNVIDVDELMTGQQRAGVYSGAMTLARKVVQGIIVMPLIGFFLQLVGFQSNQAQTPEVLSKFLIFFITGPSIFLILGIIVAMRFELSPKNSEILVKELERIRAGGRLEDVSPEVKTICEKLTGMRYEECWNKKGATEI